MAKDTKHYNMDYLFHSYDAYGPHLPVNGVVGLTA